MNHPSISKSQNSKSKLPDSAVLIADWGEDYTLSDIFGYRNDLLNVLNKPLLQRAVEQLVQLGCRKILVVLGEYATQHRAFLEIGQRWGIQITYQYRRPGESLHAQALTWVDAANTPMIWLADARCLPDLDSVRSCGSILVGNSGCTVVQQQQDKSEWSGWGLFSTNWLLSQHIAARRRDLARLLQKNEWIEKREAAQLMRAYDPLSFLASNQQLLSTDPGQTIIGRNCRISPQARIVPPVFLGQHVHIGPDAVVGPYAVVGDNCYLDKDVSVVNSVVLAATYVGQSLELTSSVVGGNTVANTLLDTVVYIDNKSLLCALDNLNPVSLGDKLGAMALQVLLLPIQLAARWKSRPHPAHVVSSYDITQLSQTRPWALHFARCFYPGLRDVIAGHLHLLGPTPRSREELEQLPESWRRLYEGTYAGLLSDALVGNIAELGPDERFASDAMALANRSRNRPKFSLLSAYVARVVRDLFKQRETRQPADAQSDGSSGYAADAIK